MIAYIIGLFFIIAGIMMWPAGLTCVIVGVIICLVRFFTKYNSVSNYSWTKTFENSSVVGEFIEYINNYHVKNISITPEGIVMDEHKVEFKSKGINDITVHNCELLANTIKNKIQDGDNYKIDTIRKSLNYSSGHDRPIGMTQTHNGNFVFDYGDRGPSYEIVGYRLSYKEKVIYNKTPKSKKSEWK